jgi:acyl-CoA synthetase (AMP-forming)/AMP-acid ligase II
VVCGLLPNGPEFLIALAATWKVGAVFAPLNPQLTPGEQRRIMQLARPRALVTAEGCTREAASAAGPEPAPEPGDALLLFTSGSTGDPKGVLLPAESVRAGVRAVVETFGLGPDDSTLALLPWTHGHGLIGVVLATAQAGGRIHVDGAPGLAAVASKAAASCTWLSVVPPTLALLCDRREASPIGARLRFIRTASAPMPPTLALRAESLFGCPVAEAYGMTETSHQAAANPPDSTRRLGTVGLPTGVEVREAGETVGGGRELEVRGRSVFRGYLSRPDLTAEALDPARWYRTHDIGVIQPEGRIRLVGRSSEIINRGGFKVSPTEVEESLSTHPAVSATLVAAVPHAALGEEILALVVVRAGNRLTIGDLQRHCREHLAAYKQPGLIRIVEEIPRLPNGKPSRRLASELLRPAG